MVKSKEDGWRDVLRKKWMEHMCFAFYQSTKHASAWVTTVLLSRKAGEGMEGSSTCWLLFSLESRK